MSWSHGHVACRNLWGFPWEFLSNWACLYKSHEVSVLQSLSYCQFETMAAYSIINIDIDTTGLLASEDQICRIFAFDNEVGHEHGQFSKFLMPTHSFPKEVSSLNGFSIEGGSLMLNGKERASVSQKKGFRALFQYIHGIGKCVLVSHNSRKFLAQFLVFGFKKYLGIAAEKLDEYGIKFADSLLIIKRSRLPGIENMQEPTIHQFLFPHRTPYQTPNARNDAIALHEILAKLKIGKGEIIENSFTATSIDI